MKAVRFLMGFALALPWTLFAQQEFFPVATGAKWEYRVTFAATASLPYRPVVEYPEGILCASFFCGMGSWTAGQISFEMSVGDIAEQTSTSTTWNLAPNLLMSKFHFFLADTSRDRYQLRLTNDGTTSDLAIILLFGQSDPWRLARHIAHLTSTDLGQQHTISVPAGQFSNCVSCTMKLYGDGMYVPTGTYPVETYLAPGVGIVQAIGKSSSNATLYTLELTRFTAGSDVVGPALPPPTLALPTDGSTGVSRSPTLSWEAVSGATSYRLQISRDPGFSTTIVDEHNLTETSYAAGGLTNSTTYYWRVCACGPAGTSDWSISCCFTTAETSGLPPTLRFFTSHVPSEFPKSDLEFIGANLGKIWVAGDSGVIARAEDNTLASWTLLNSGIPKDEFISWLEFVGTQTLFAGSGSGRIYRSTNSGGTWTVVFSDATLTNFINYIKFFDASRGIANGDGLSGSATMAFLETTDGGATWKNNNSYLVGTGYPCIVRFPSPDHGYLLGYRYGSDQSTIARGIWRTGDLGKTWSFATIGTTSADSTARSDAIDFLNGMNGLISRRDSTIWKTTDGGATWQLIARTAARCYGIQYLASDFAVAVGGSGRVVLLDPGGSSMVNSQQVDPAVDLFMPYFSSPTSGFILSFYNSGSIYGASAATTSIPTQRSSHPTGFALFQNYPNPFNPATTIRFALPRSCRAVLKIYDMLGRQVAELLNAEMSEGMHSIQWNSGSASGGVYFYRLQAADYVETKSMILLR
jgi:photosystem II stability/assembly factor-like uncharacterized protein